MTSGRLFPVLFGRGERTEALAAAAASRCLVLIIVVDLRGRAGVDVMGSG
jgi:hypothetical protein